MTRCARCRRLLVTIAPRLWAVTALVALAGAAVACGRAGRADPTTQDRYVVTLVTEPAPATEGEGQLVITLADPTGAPVDGARLDVEANMSHAGMVPVLASTAESRAGTYRVPIRWTMRGDWYVDLVFTLPDGQRVARRLPVQVR